MGPVTRRLRALGHPAVVAALAVLVVNDHVLKGWSGGVDGTAGVVARTVTGKASDVAGVLLLAVLLGALTGWRRASVAAVGVGFTALKLSPAVADAAVPVLGGRTRTDPWDLLALVALVPAARLLGRPAPTPPTRPPADALRPAWASLRATLGLAVVVASVPAVTATSCAHPSEVTDLFARPDGTVLARLTTDPISREPNGRWAVSTNAGRTWVATEPPSDAPRRHDPTPVSGCTTTGTCYRLDDAAVAVRPPGEEWRTAFAFSAEEQRRMELRSRTGTCSSAPRPTDGFESLVVVDDAVVVSMSSQGVLRRDHADDPDGPDGWERVAVLDTGPIRTDGPSWLARLEVAPVVLAVAGTGLVLALSWALSRRWWSWMLGPAITLTGAALLGCAWLATAVGFSIDYTVLGPGLAIGSVIVLLVALAATVFTSRRPPSGPPRPVAWTPSPWPPPGGPGPPAPRRPLAPPDPGEAAAWRRPEEGRG